MVTISEERGNIKLATLVRLQPLNLNVPINRILVCLISTGDNRVITQDENVHI